MAATDLSDEEIGYLLREGELTAEDVRGTAADPVTPPDTTLKDGLAALVSAIKGIEPPKAEKVTVSAPQVTVNCPRRGNYKMTVTKRDSNGLIAEVDLRAVGA